MKSLCGIEKKRQIFQIQLRMNRRDFYQKGLFTKVNSIEIQGENTATGKVKVKCLTSAAHNHMVIEDGQYIT